jgi:hypothetical protein
MSVVPPRVSTSPSDDHGLGLGQALRPDDSMACTNVGRPVGMAAIAV